jgi:hypothetical protein
MPGQLRLATIPATFLRNAESWQFMLAEWDIESSQQQERGLKCRVPSVLIYQGLEHFSHLEARTIANFVLVETSARRLFPAHLRRSRWSS